MKAPRLLAVIIWLAITAFLPFNYANAVDVLVNPTFSSNDGGWLGAKTSGENNGACDNGQPNMGTWHERTLTFSYAQSTVTQTVVISMPSTVTFSVTARNRADNAGAIANVSIADIASGEFVASTQGQVITLTKETSDAMQNIVIAISGRDNRFWAGCYGTMFTNASLTIIPLAPTIDTSTVTTDTSTAVIDTSTAITDTSTVVVDTPTVVASPEPIIEPSPTPSPIATPEPTPTVIVEPSPSPQPAPQPVPQPDPAPQPAPQPTQEPIVVPTPIKEPEPSPSPTPDPTPSIEPTPDPMPSASPEPSVEPSPSATPDPTPSATPTVEPSPTPTVEPTPAPSVQSTPQSVVDNSAPVSIANVDVSTLPPDTPVELANGVVLTAEVVVALQVLDNPMDLLTNVFTDPAEVFLAIANIGADMSPKARAKSQDVVVATVITSNIAATTIAYRRKP